MAISVIMELKTFTITEGMIISSDVKEYGLTYNGAQDALDYYCY